MMTTSLNRNYIGFLSNEGLQPGTGGKPRQMTVGQGAWWSATGDQMSQDWCYLRFLFMIQSRELGTQSWNVQMLPNSEALQIEGTRKKWDQWAGREKWISNFKDLSEETQMKHWKQWSWKGCPRGFFIQEDLNVKPKRLMWATRTKCKIEKMENFLNCTPCPYSFQGWG